MLLFLRGRRVAGGPPPPPPSAPGPAFLESSRLDYLDKPFEGAFGSLFGNWTSLLADTRASDPIVCEYGFRTDALTDLVAGPGQLTASLNNAATNTVGALGAYSPLHVQKRVGFDLDRPVRWVLRFQGIDYYKFFGKIADIDPDHGIGGARVSRLVCKDVMDDWMRQTAPALPIMENVDDMALLKALLTAASADPDAQAQFAFNSGIELYQVALDNVAPDATVREVLIDICRSGFGKFAIHGGQYSVGTWRFWNRHAAHLAPVVAHHFNNDIDLADDALVAPSVRTDIVSRVRTTTRAVTSDALIRTIWTLDAPVVTPIYPLQTITLKADYTGIAGETGAAIVTPPTLYPNSGFQQIPTDPDWTCSGNADGTGSLMTVSVTCTAVIGSTEATLSFRNNDTTRPAYLRTARLRGRSLYATETDFEHVVDTDHGDRAVDIYMPYQTFPEVGRSVGQWVALIHSKALRRVQSIRFLANKSAERMRAALSLEIGARIAITEPVLGLVADEYIVRSVQLELHEGRVLWCTWGLEPAATTRPCLLGIVGSAELGVTTNFGF